MKILLFDDHTFVLDSIKNFLKHQKDVEVIGAYTTKESILEVLAKEQVDVLISDVLTDQEIGLSLFEEIQRLDFDVKIVVYSSINSDFVKQFLFEYGVLSFVNKREPIEKLWEAVQLVFLNTRYKQKYSNGEQPPQLTAKEQDIARYLAKGLAAKEIAAITGNSVNTVNNQKTHLLAKFDCTNSTELTLRLLQMGYLKL